ncbi:MAG: serine hydrolase domain-containing protein, partial [Hyphococcus sp.]
GFSGTIMSGLADVDGKVKVAPDHLFQIGSITKMMTSLAAWSLIDEGKLSPDDRLAELLPGLQIRDGDAITLQHLLDHTSGLPRGAPMILDGGLWTGYPAGSQWSYSNLGYKLAGAIIAKADARTYPDSVAERVLRPLGMTSSLGAMRGSDRARYAQGYHPALTDRPFARPPQMVEAPWVNYDGASGCVASTASDMALFLRFLLGLADGEGASLFSDETAARFLADPADAPGWSEGARYGNGIAHIQKDERLYLHHTGGMVSFSSSLHVDPVAGVAAFASANAHYALNYRPRDVTLFACDRLRSGLEDAAAGPPPETKPRVETPAIYAGIYTSRDGDQFEIVAGSESIRMRRSGETSMQPVGDHRFASADKAFDITGVDFSVEDEAATHAWAGGRQYTKGPSGEYLPEPAAALKALAGRYENDDRWSVPIRVYARHDHLVMKQMNYHTKLTQLDNGDWRPGDKEWWPDWVRFDGFLNGAPQRLLISGVPFYRRFS